MTTMSLKLPLSLDQAIESLATASGRSKSAVVRDAVIAYLASLPAVAEGSFLAAAGRLLGSVEGPEDLAANPAHLEEYGQ